MINNKIKKIIKYWYLRTNRTKHLVNHIRHNVIVLKKNDLWTYYRLGMYNTVATSDLEVSHRLSLHAKAVSFAAVGEEKKSREIVRIMLGRKDCRSHLVSLADALAPYMPELSLEIVKYTKTPEVLQAALLLCVGSNKDARRVLKTAFVKKKYLSQPELYLYSSNASSQLEPQKRIDYLNKFFSFYNIPHLTLKSPILPPSPLNVYVKEKLPDCNAPLVSVLMTTFETGSRASVAIESVLKQTYQNIELIIIDDASKDDTPEIIEEWMKKDARVKLVRLPKNVGTYVAKNIGLLMAKGEFATCHDSDDWSHPLKIELQVKPLLEKATLIASISYWVRMQDDGVYYARPVHPMIRQNPSSLLFRREKVVAEAGLWDCVKTGADSEFIARLKCVFGKSKVKRILKPLSLGSHRENSLMTSFVTGYSEKSISPQRLEYWESWSQWHLDCLQNKKIPIMPSSIEEIIKKRKFKAPKNILPHDENIKVCLYATSIVE